MKNGNSGKAGEKNVIELPSSWGQFDRIPFTFPRGFLLCVVFEYERFTFGKIYVSHKWLSVSMPVEMLL